MLGEMSFKKYLKVFGSLGCQNHHLVTEYFEVVLSVALLDLTHLLVKCSHEVLEAHHIGVHLFQVSTPHGEHHPPIVLKHTLGPMIEVVHGVPNILGRHLGTQLYRDRGGCGHLADFAHLAKGSLGLVDLVAL